MYISWSISLFKEHFKHFIFQLDKTNPDPNHNYEPKYCEFSGVYFDLLIKNIVIWILKIFKFVSESYFDS